jgi:hypothetical protein
MVFDVFKRVLIFQASEAYLGLTFLKRMISPEHDAFKRWWRAGRYHQNSIGIIAARTEADMNQN